MINTDKYEGHTLDDAYSEVGDRGCWCVINLRASSIINGIAGVNKPTAQLIADAPLLLAEVNDLLAEIRQLNNIIGAFDDFMCNNWTPANVHSLWNELLTKEEE
tara:strand:- start:305 stop:616 length:312 start_codon:yes stop_codon:yes gene_type:complete